MQNPQESSGSSNTNDNSGSNRNINSSSVDTPAASAVGSNVPSDGTNSTAAPAKPQLQSQFQRPQSMLFAYTPPIADIATENALPELQPIFSFLNGHAHKTYHEGYLLKLNDLDLSKLDGICSIPNIKY